MAVLGRILRETINRLLPHRQIQTCQPGHAWPQRQRFAISLPLEDTMIGICNPFDRSMPNLQPQGRH